MRVCFLTLSLLTALAAQPSKSPAFDVASIFPAIARLGLKLEPAKAPAGFLVIDHVERPTAN